MVAVECFLDFDRSQRSPIMYHGHGITFKTFISFKDVNRIKECSEGEMSAFFLIGRPQSFQIAVTLVYSLCVTYVFCTYILWLLPSSSLACKRFLISMGKGKEKKEMIKAKVGHPHCSNGSKRPAISWIWSLIFLVFVSVHLVETTSLNPLVFMVHVIIPVSIFAMWNDKFNSQAIQSPALKGASKYLSGNTAEGHEAWRPTSVTHLQLLWPF